MALGLANKYKSLTYFQTARIGKQISHKSSVPEVRGLSLRPPSGEAAKINPVRSSFREGVAKRERERERDEKFRYSFVGSSSTGRLSKTLPSGRRTPSDRMI